MKGPLPASPRSPPVNAAAALFVIKYTVTVNDFHLHYPIGDPPVSITHLFPAEAEFLNHSLLVILIKRDRGFSLAAVPAAGTLKNFLKLHFF